MRVSTDDRIKLVDALKDSFSTKADMEQLASRIGKGSLDQLALGDDLTDVIDKVVGKAQDGDWTDELIKAALAMRSADIVLQALNQSYAMQEPESEAPLDPLTVCRFGRRVLVDRTDLKKTVIPLLKGDSKILIVDGERYSGRTHSLYFLSYLASKADKSAEKFRIELIDFKELVDAYGEVRPEHVGARIAAALRLDGFPGRQNQTAGAWWMDYDTWLNQRYPGIEECCWIVLDSFDKEGVFVPEDVHRFIASMAKRIETSWYEKLRLILLSYGDPTKLPPDLMSGVEYEEIKRVEQEHLVNFFLNLVTQKAEVVVADEDIAEWVADVWSAVDHGKAETRLIDLSKKAFEKAEENGLIVTGAGK